MADIRSRLEEQRRIMLGGFKRIDIDGITDYEIKPNRNKVHNGEKFSTKSVNN